jgi:hypothetical protein
MGVEAFSEPAGEAIFEDVNDQAVEAAAAQRFEAQETPPETPEAPPEPEPAPAQPAEPQEPETPPEPPPEPQSRQPWKFDDLGVTIDEQVARQYALFEHRLRTDPEFAQRVLQALEPQPVAPAPPTPPATPEPELPDFDYSDPAVKYLHDQMQAMRQELEAARAELNGHSQYIQTTQAQSAQSMVDTAVRNFQTRTGFSDADMAEIRQFAGTRVALGPEAQTDPIGAVENALEVARWSIPRFREQALGQTQTQMVEDRKRQKKLAAVTGNSGAAPRTPPEPRTPTERKQAMKAAIREAWQGNEIE